MKINCRFCGASVDSSAKICPGCGKVMPAYHGVEAGEGSQFSNSNKRDGLTNNRIRTQTPYAANRSGRQMDKLDPNYGTKKARREHLPDNYDPRKEGIKQQPFTTGTGTGKQAYVSKLGNGIGYFFTFILIIMIAFIMYATARVLAVTRSSYDFELGSGMHLANKNYGEAFDAYFKEQHWWFDITCNKVTFRGTNSNGEEYEMWFGRTADGQTAVKELYIDGQKVFNENNRIMEAYILSAFMTEKDIQHATALGKGADTV